MEGRTTTQRAVFENTLTIKDQIFKTKKLAGSIGLGGGAIADLARPLGPWTLVFALLFMGLAGWAGYIWFGSKKKELDELLSNGSMGVEDYNETVSSNIFVKIFSYSSVIGLILVFFFSFNAIAGKDIDDKPRGALASVITPLRKIQDTLFSIQKDLKDIKQGIGDIKKGIKGLGQLGGLIATPQKAQDYYHNARIYGLRSDRAKARKAYAKYITFNLKHLDPHLSYIRILKDAEGRSETRRIYQRLKQKYPKNPAIAYAYSLLLEDKARLTALKQLLVKYPDYLPIIARLSLEYSYQQRGSQTSAERREEMRYLSLFKQKNGLSRMLSFYLDKKEGQKELDRIKIAMKLYGKNSYIRRIVQKPITLQAREVNKGVFSLTIIAKEVTTAMWYKLEGMSNYKSTGFYPMKNPVTGKKMPKVFFMTKKMHLGENIVWVKYKDAKDKIVGPVKLIANIETKELTAAKNFVAYQWSNPIIKRIMVNYFRGRTMIYPLWTGQTKIFKEIKYSFDNPRLNKYYVRNGRKVRRSIKKYLSRRPHTFYIKATLVSGWTTGVIKYFFTPKRKGNDKISPAE